MPNRSPSLWLLAAMIAAGCPAPQPQPQEGAPPRAANASDQGEAKTDTAAPRAQGPGATPATARTPAQIRAEGNHLVGEPSPYLEQHAHNPVDWYPWGPEALAKAKREHKPIFLSIGYSTCHWCHVMEKESFEDDEVAAYLNEHFVSIKVDREQRPDVDALYIDAVSALGGSTGWPLTVFLTPGREPFHGGTYYPRHASRGRPGFMDVLAEVQASFAADGGEDVAKNGRAILARVEKSALGRVKNPSQLGAAIVDDAMVSLSRARDLQHGGFGRRQKFPNSPLLLAELRHTKRTANADSRAHLERTLDEIAAGGIHDHIAGTFHRYAVDTRWHLPHFEKMLYDNAQLAGVYIEAGLAFGRDDYVQTGRAVLDDLIAHWQQPDGGFVVGFDADDPEGEGAFYSWTPSELTEALGAADARVMATAFGVTKEGDREIEGRSVLHRRPDEDVASELGIGVEALRETIDRSLRAMAPIRAKRPPPATDDKELVAWNGLAVIAMADAGRWLDEPRYVEAAARAGAFILDTCWKDGTMSRGVRRGGSIGSGFLDDYALAGLALIRLHAATGDTRWLVGAREIGAAVVEKFYDPKRYTFLRTPAGDESVPVRLSDMEDGVMPSGGSAATLLALELGAIAGDSALYAVGTDVLERTARSAAGRPFSAGFVLVAVDHATAPVREVVLAGASDSPTTAALWKAIAPTTHARILPVRLPAAGPSPALEKSLPALLGKKARRGDATVYVCEQGRCELPTSDPAVLRKQLLAATTPPA
ncbi:MAG: thioredoxin domain-containing protein [Myxococcota bacterium]